MTRPRRPRTSSSRSRGGVSAAGSGSGDWRGMGGEASRASSGRRVSANERASRRSERKLKGRHVLDVTIRSSRETRLRRAAHARLALKAAAVVICFIAVGAGAKTILSRALYETDAAELHDIEVRTNGSLTRARVIREAKIEEGANLLEIDLEGIRERLERLPQVAEARVTRHFPDRISIALDERVPLAWISCPPAGVASHTSSGGYLLDTQGHVFRCELLLAEYLPLPVIELPNLTRIRDGEQLVSEPVAAAVDLLELAREGLREAPGWDPARIEIASDYALRVSFHNDADVIFSTAELSRQIDDLLSIIAHAADTGAHIATLNLMMERNIPVTYFEMAGDADPAAAAPSRLPSAPPAATFGAGGSEADVSEEGTDPDDRRLRQARGILTGG